MTTTLTGLSPENGSNTTLTRPFVQFVVWTDESDPVVQFEYWISTSSSPTTDPNAIYLSTTQTLVFTGFASNHTVSMELPATVGLTPGTWYIFGRISGNSIPLGSITNLFTVTFTPSATQTSPGPGEAKPFADSVNNLMLTWTFNGNSYNEDYQTAYQVTVNRVDNGVLIVDTGKVSSIVGQAVVTIPSSQQDVELSWRVRVWNKWDIVSPYTGSSTFILAAAFVLSITSPTNNQILSAGNPNLVVNITISAGRTVKAVTASAWQSNTKVWEKTVFGNWATGSSLNITDSVSVFGVASYVYRVVAQDNFATFSPEATRNFSVSYSQPVTPPGGPTIVLTNYETLGFITVRWNDSARDSDYYAWEVQRKDDIIDVDTLLVVAQGTWEPTGRTYGIAASYTFNDYLAPSNHKITYRIVQVALKYGSEVKSAPSPTSASYFPFSGKYWLYAGANGDPGGVCLPLWNITADSFTDECETSEFVLIGRGRYSERGSYLGVRGTLEMKLRTEAGYTARQKRLLVMNFRMLYPTAKLRNPFGDVYTVTLNDITVSRIAGTGKSEFCDVTVPYVEVVS